MLDNYTYVCSLSLSLSLKILIIIGIDIEISRFFSECYILLRIISEIISSEESQDYQVKIKWPPRAYLPSIFLPLSTQIALIG